MKRIGNRRRRVMIDARLGLGSGIGRYVQNIVPRVTARLHEIDFELVVHSHEVERMNEIVCEGAANLVIRSEDTQPFSVAEQTTFVAHARNVDATWFVNYWVPLRWPGPYMVVVHDLLHLANDLFPTSLPKRLLSRSTFEKVRRTAGEIIFISRFTEREFASRVGQPNGRSTVIHHGVDHFGNTAVTAPPEKRSQMIVVAAAKRHKNFDVIMEAWRGAAFPIPWKLIVVLPGDSLRSSIVIDSSSKDGHRLDIRRGVSDAELWQLYRESSVLLMPSRYEGFGLPLLEGMMHGCLPISSTADALVEVGAGGAVTYVPPNDVEGWVAAMQGIAQRIEADPAWFDDAARHNMSHAREWRWDDAAERTAAVLERLLSGRANATRSTSPNDLFRMQG